VSILSWKSVELQVALPRTQDAGKLQEQLSRQNQRYQESLAANQLKQAEIKKQQVNDLKESNKAEIKDEHREEKDEPSEHNQNQKNENQKSKEALNHPFLGSKIDYSG